MREKIKLVVTDIDGTLVKDSSPTVYPEMTDMIRKLTRMGITVCIASGRQYSSIEKMFGEVKDKLEFIADNGAHIRCGGEDMHVVRMDKDYVRELTEELKAIPECERIYEAPGITYIEHEDERFISLIRDQYRCEVRIVDDVLSEDRGLIKVSAHMWGSIRELGEKRLIPRWKDRLKATMAGEDWVDFMDRSVDKGNALGMLQEHFGISPEETIVFGDNDNDAGMLERAAYRIAVENASDRIKELATDICPSWEHKGVYTFLHKIFGDGEDFSV